MPVTSSILQLQPVNLQLWFTLLGIALSLILLDESHKLVRTLQAERRAA